MADRGKVYRFRFYLRPVGSRWYANCIDLCLDAEGETPEETRDKIHDALVGYLQTVLDQNLGEEFLRRSSWEHWAWYWSIKAWCWLRSVVPRMRLPERCRVDDIYLITASRMGFAFGLVKRRRKLRLVWSCGKLKHEHRWRWTANLCCRFALLLPGTGRSEGG